MKTLLLMRHAKSDWDAEYGRDHDRPLNSRGERSARLMGRLLTSKDLAPDWVISSTANRARTTATLAKAAGGWEAQVDLEPGFYGSGPHDVLERASGAPAVDRLMLMGHQPTWGMLARLVTGEFVDVKTATVVVVRLDIDAWAGLPGASGDLVAVHQPRDHFDGPHDS